MTTTACARAATAVDHARDFGVDTDLAGLTRPYGSAPDIGAYEWVDFRYGLYLPVTLRR